MAQAQRSRTNWRQSVAGRCGAISYVRLSRCGYPRRPSIAMGLRTSLAGFDSSAHRCSDPRPRSQTCSKRTDLRLLLDCKLTLVPRDQCMSPDSSISIAQSRQWADRLGTWTSALCLVHCLLTPALLSFSAVFAHFLPADESVHRTL